MVIQRGRVKDSDYFQPGARRRLFLGFLGHRVGLFSILVALSIASKRLKGLLGYAIFEWEFHTRRVY